MRVKFSLKIKFIILTLFAFVTLGLALFFYINYQLTNFLLTNEKNYYQEGVQKTAAEYFNLEKRTSLKLEGKQDEFIRNLEKKYSLKNSSLVESNGLVIASTLKDNIIGKNLLSELKVQKALDGEPQLSNENLKTKTAEIAIPITSHDNSVRGVLLSEIALGNNFNLLNPLLSQILFGGGIISIIFGLIYYWIFSDAEKTMSDNEHSVIDKSKALEEEQQLDEAIMSSIAESLIVINKEGQIMLFNPEAERITGKRSSDVEYRLYRKIIPFYDKDGKEISKNPITEALHSGKKYSINIKEGYYLKNENKELIPISVNAAPINSKEGNIRGVAVTIQDISTEKELDKVKDEFVYVVAHELGNPIFALDGYLSILEMKSNHYDKQTKDTISSAKNLNQQLSALVNDLLEITRNESGQLVFEMAPIKLPEIINGVLEGAKFKAKTKNIKLKYKEEKIPPVRGNEQKVKEVVINLVDNAIKYTPEGGMVEIFHQLDNNFVTTNIKDNGLGMDEESKKHLFEKFFRIKNEKTQGISGTGLGLFICKQIIEKCGGKIWAESTDGKGSTFSFSLKTSKAR